MDESTNIIDTVRQYAQDIEATKERIKVLKERKAEVLEGSAAHNEVLRLKELLKAAQEHAKRELQADSDWMDITEDLGQEQASLKDQKEIVSSYLLEHYRTTGENHQIDLGSGGAREVSLVGKLGKPVEYQTNMFSEASDASEVS